MFDKALNSLLGATIICASAALAIFAAGFALYALVLPYVGPAGGAAIVAASASVLIGAAGLLHRMRAKQREAERAAAQVELTSAIPEPLRGLMQKHPIGAIAVTIVGGILAARNPRIIREVITALRSAPRN